MEFALPIAQSTFTTTNHALLIAQSTFTTTNHAILIQRTHSKLPTMEFSSKEHIQNYKPWNSHPKSTFKTTNHGILIAQSTFTNTTHAILIHRVYSRQQSTEFPSPTAHSP
jgi:hypothetical protein